MKKAIIAFLLIGSILGYTGIVDAQITNNTWKVISNVLEPVLSSWGVKIPSLGSSGNPCLSVSTTGLLATTTCGSGGGGSPLNTNPLSATYFTATSTSATSTLPNLSTTNLQVNGFLYANILPLQDTAANLSAIVASSGEQVYETDTKCTKFGDGTTTIANLDCNVLPSRTTVFIAPQTFTSTTTFKNDLYFAPTSSPAYYIELGNADNAPDLKLVLPQSTLSDYSGSNRTGGQGGSFSIQAATGLSTPGPTSVYSTYEGGTASSFTFTGAVGGASAYNNTNVSGYNLGGDGSSYTIVLGQGGNATSSPLAGQGGNGGRFLLQGAAGGSVLNGGGLGGNGSSISFTAGQGGGANGYDPLGIGNQPGEGGSIDFTAGSVPDVSLSTTGDYGNYPGSVFFTAGGSGQVLTNPQQSNNGGDVGLVAGYAYGVTGFPNKSGNVLLAAGQARGSGPITQGDVVVGYTSNGLGTYKAQYSALAIGTTSPLASLTVVGTSTSYLPYAFAAYTSSAKNPNFIVSNSNGYVGIGTSSPSNALEVNGNMFLNGNASTTGAITVSKQATFGSLASGQNALVVDPGNASFRHFYGGTDSRYQLSSNGTNDYSLGSGYDAGALYLGSGTVGASGGYSSTIISGGGSGTGKFSLFVAGTSSPRLVVDSNGHVGIGTTSPSTALEVNGNGYLNGNLTLANLTATGTETLTALSGSPSFIAVDNNGKIIATTTPTGSGTPGGSNGQVQYNNGGSFGGTSTTTLVAGSNITFTGGTPVVLGSSPVTIAASGGGGSSAPVFNVISTSTLINIDVDNQASTTAQPLLSAGISSSNIQFNLSDITSSCLGGSFFLEVYTPTSGNIGSTTFAASTTEKFAGFGPYTDGSAHNPIGSSVATGTIDRWRINCTATSSTASPLVEIEYDNAF